MAKYAPNAQATAKAGKLLLVNLEINGRYAKEASATVSGPVGKKFAKRIWKLWADMTNEAKRME